jgi:DUF1680 family protein
MLMVNDSKITLEGNFLIKFSSNINNNEVYEQNIGPKEILLHYNCKKQKGSHVLFSKIIVTEDQRYLEIPQRYIFKKC